MEHFNEPVKHLIDAISIVTVFSTIAAWLPPVAALFSLIWSVIRIYETKTIQRILQKCKD